ncbi:hypothetical protein J7J24_01325 [bacterium]|nr:hypothetical protein [bacterium]
MTKNFNWYLLKIQRISGVILLVLVILFFISGYGTTRQIIDPIFAKILHEKILPVPFVFFLLLHISFWLKRWLLRWIKDEKWVNIYLIILEVIIFILFVVYFAYE